MDGVENGRLNRTSESRDPPRRENQMRRTILAASTLGLAAALAIPTAASAAAKGKDIPWTKTKDRAPGGKAMFSHKSNKVTVCDIEDDNWAAVVFVEKYIGGKWLHELRLRDGGNDDHCKSKVVPLIEGTKIRLRVTLTNRKNGWGGEWRYERVSRTGNV